MISIRPVSSITELEKIALLDLSYSKIDSYMSCPAKYFFSYIKKEPKRFSDAAALRKHGSFSFGRKA
jgi:hypothetical protein